MINIIIVSLLVMAVLLGVVSSLSLMGTMSMNVLERTREIGVLRAIGMTTVGVMRIVLAEGMLVTWAAAVSATSGPNWSPK